MKTLNYDTILGKEMKFYLEYGSNKKIFDSKEERDQFIKDNNIKCWIVKDFDSNRNPINDSGEACFSGLF